MPLVAPDTVPYVLWFTALCVVCLVVVLRTRSKETVAVTADFKKFQRGFLVVYLCMMMADWMQGPYVYALYEFYGFGIDAIARLFIIGFGSSMVFGTFVGGLADRFGRRANCLAFGVLYALSCVTKHFNDYNTLMLGRLLGGIATSILYSAFETWMIHEHKSAGFPEEWLSNTFAIMTFGNGLIAIVAGVIASTAAASVSLVTPFDLSMILLIAGTVYIAAKWTENYGDSTTTGACDNFRQAWSVLMSNERVLLLGIIQSCFESAMYIFVFIWTPSLTSFVDEDVVIPHGLIFAGFMVCIMIGSNLFRVLMGARSVEFFLRFAFLLGAFALAVPVIMPGHNTNLMAFCLFEVVCGIYFPSVGTMRGKYVPEEVRATVMNIFRIGLNLIVVVVLANIKYMSLDAVFILVSLLLSLATLAQHRLFALTSTNASSEQREREGLEAGEEVDELLNTKEDVAA